MLAVLATRSLGRIDDEAEVHVAELESSVGRPSSPRCPTWRCGGGGVAWRVPRRPGTAIVRQGEEGDIVYVIARGTRVREPGRRRAPRAGPDNVFGELALILDVPRTATVTATEPLVLRTLAREPFLAAVTGNQLSGDELRRIVAARTPAELAADRPASLQRA